MSKFSVTILPRNVMIYKCTFDVYRTIILPFDICSIEDIMCQTFLEDEVTIYRYSDHVDTTLSKFCMFDPRLYHIINIHEDIPGIDHIGIIAMISKMFSEKGIPILYINTYSYNLVLVSSEWMEMACEALKSISNI